MKTQIPAAGDLIEVGRYRSLRAANDRALVILAMGLGYWMFREENEFVLCIEQPFETAVGVELQRFESEHRSQRRAALYFAEKKSSSISPFAFVWIMIAFFFAQQDAPPWLMDAGAASSGWILRGQLWRCITALTLHADIFHLTANVVAGLIFARALLPLLGGGITWLAIIASGATGNLLNAFIYRNEMHTGIGASTAVFGALGILVAHQLAHHFLAAGARPSKWEILLPLGAGLSLLGYLGTSGENTDVLAHLSGFITGLAIGAVIAFFKIESRATAKMQHFCAAVALVSTPAAWLCAWFLGRV